MCVRILVVTALAYCAMPLVSCVIRKSVRPDYDNWTTCEELSKTSRFNPYSVLNTWWFVFYYWDMPRTPKEMYHFYVPTNMHIQHMQELLDGRTAMPVDWSARLVMMTSRDNISSLLVERGDRGEYWMYNFHARVRKGKKLKAIDIRIKQTGDNRLLAIMDCRRRTLIVMCKLNDIPDKRGIQDAAARIGFRGRGGKSYLYQGGDWMPTYEMDEHDYWLPPDVKFMKQFEKDDGDGDDDDIDDNDDAQNKPEQQLEEKSSEETKRGQNSLRM